MISTTALKTQSLKDLAALAKKKGVGGWQSMKKDQLIRALTKSTPAKASKPASPKPAPSKKKAAAKKKPSVAVRAVSKLKPTKAKTVAPIQPKPAVKPAAKNGAPAKIAPKAAPKETPKPAKIEAKPALKPSRGKPAAANGAKATSPATQAKVSARIHQAQAMRDRLKDLSGSGFKPTEGRKSDRDRIVLMVRDPYWMQAVWNVTRNTVKRAEAALAEHWHTARPVLRLLEVDGGTTTSTSERMAREIEIHGGVTNWYIEVIDPPKSYRVDLGYLAANGKYFGICRSNSVTTPSPDSTDVIDENWKDIAENYEKIYALSGGYSEENASGELQELFEERLQRPMTPPNSAQFGMGAERMINRQHDFDFQVDAEMILFGATRADARVTLAGEPIKLRPDGSFTLRLAMPDKRQVLPVVATSSNGIEQRTIVIAVERNTKTLEPMVREQSE